MLPSTTAICFTLLYASLPSVNSGEGPYKREIKAVFGQQYGNLKENCFYHPGGGCYCKVKDSNGIESVRNYESNTDCSTAADAVHNKVLLNKEISDRFGDFKENCFPKPSGGCRCSEKDDAGNDVVRQYNKVDQCMVSRNVRDPVRERAQANYRAVINELNEKFKGLKEGCFPRPRGCLCVVGKDRDGRDKTERRMRDKDCKCQPGEHGAGCPAAGA